VVKSVNDWRLEKKLLERKGGLQTASDHLRLKGNPQRHLIKLGIHDRERTRLYTLLVESRARGRSIPIPQSRSEGISLFQQGDQKE